MLAVGKIGSLFGDRGGIAVSLYDVFPQDFDIEGPVYVEIDGHRVPLFFEELRRRGVRGAVVRFADIDTAERARELLGLEFYIGPSVIGLSSVIARSEADEAIQKNPQKFESGFAPRSSVSRSPLSTFHFQFSTIIGWEVEVGDGRGRITDFFDSAMNPLLEVEIGGATELIPAQAEFIAGIDERASRLTLVLPEGLLGLNG